MKVETASVHQNGDGCRTRGVDCCTVLHHVLERQACRLESQGRSAQLITREQRGLVIVGCTAWLLDTQSGMDCARGGCRFMSLTLELRHACPLAASWSARFVSTDVLPDVP
jgi:hypothetical protein